ncbi:hypothetical protein FisN_24Lh030 [Fistulifera solaris]|uniref:Uncharacterized protein n=1 Tax=Fistulifera solaris TaxID=1519565 RepID=A0A1Z5KTN9_FISSO|nr:hypothetical protein FisN_24Lh030 [Fistulifera solaris]|eukprot:GAX29577.1 hypothetical protein FisN_24Lh030 [Fistulifera solaris]
MPSKALLAALVCAITASAFVPYTPTSRSLSASSSTTLHFGIPDFLTPKQPETEEAKQPKEEKKIGISGVLQLITAGMGAPFLGDFEGVDEETGKFMFSLEANNLVDENGNSKQTQMPYFENGWVDPEDEARAAQGFKFPWQK